MSITPSLKHVDPAVKPVFVDDLCDLRRDSMILLKFDSNLFKWNGEEEEKTNLFGLSHVYFLNTNVWSHFILMGGWEYNAVRGTYTGFILNPPLFSLVQLYQLENLFHFK